VPGRGAGRQCRQRRAERSAERLGRRSPGLSGRHGRSGFSLCRSGRSSHEHGTAPTVPGRGRPTMPAAQSRAARSGDTAATEQRSPGLSGRHGRNRAEKSRPFGKTRPQRSLPLPFGPVSRPCPDGADRQCRQRRAERLGRRSPGLSGRHGRNRAEKSRPFGKTRPQPILPLPFGPVSRPCPDGADRQCGQRRVEWRRRSRAARSGDTAATEQRSPGLSGRHGRNRAEKSRPQRILPLPFGPVSRPFPDGAPADNAGSAEQSGSVRRSPGLSGRHGRNRAEKSRPFGKTRPQRILPLPFGPVSRPCPDGALADNAGGAEQSGSVGRHGRNRAEKSRPFRKTRPQQSRGVPAFREDTAAAEAEDAAATEERAAAAGVGALP